MLAVIEINGKQYHIKEKDIIKVAKLNHYSINKIEKSNDDCSIIFTKVLALYGDDTDAKVKFGKPFLSSVKIIAKIVKKTKDAKIVIFKKKRRHNYKRKKGHRQNVTILQIKKIEE